ncbi:hypothetical protein B296_00010058 [Ensete ventricosum]|uniref:Uncharacterized protein n=1 Tax=Ensete ventricosum TaxID=4639 RepID=A0A427A094_ENSVE|nr:hypothetical protein B296_00010058 [Ensete ventricosum]
MASLGSSIDVRSIPPARSGGTSLGSPVASTSGLSSGVPSLINAKSQRDLEVMKACHDIDLAMAEGSLDAIRKCYSIPDEYALCAPLPEQHPYNSGSAELSISVDALEADLRFPFHPIIEECLGWWRIFSSQVIIGKHKSHRSKGSSRAPFRDKELAASSEEPTPSVYRRLKSMKDLCRTTVHKYDEEYYVLQTVDLPPRDPNFEIRDQWLNLKSLAQVWDDS